MTEMTTIAIAKKPGKNLFGLRITMLQRFECTPLYTCQNLYCHSKLLLCGFVSKNYCITVAVIKCSKQATRMADASKGAFLQAS
jgi:hypothetical protein